MSQSWALSQNANKATGICRVCRATRQIHNKDGTVRRHGPHSSPSPGSNKPPLSIVNSNGQQWPQTSAAFTQDSSPIITHSISSDSQPTAWQPPDCTTVKHIHKSARPFCAAQLSSLLRKVVDHPDDKDSWLAVFNWPTSILHPPKLGGRRFNISNTIKKRIDQFTGSMVSEFLTERRNGLRSCEPTAALARAVSAKLEVGNMRSAI